ncbi:unnamed protein product [Ectocarpus fasciculatus]
MLDDSREALAAKESETVKPVALGNTKVVVGKASATPVDPKAIWKDSEIPLEDAVICRSDGRPAPRYEISYSQSVGTEDTFLGLSGKSAASSDCNTLVIKIHFPGEALRDIHLDVTTNRIVAESKNLSLFTYLPVNVVHEKGSAKFDSAKHVLTVSVPIVDEFEGMS